MEPSAPHIVSHSPFCSLFCLSVPLGNKCLSLSLGRKVVAQPPLSLWVSGSGTCHLLNLPWVGRRDGEKNEASSGEVTHRSHETTTTYPDGWEDMETTAIHCQAQRQGTFGQPTGVCVRVWYQLLTLDQGLCLALDVSDLIHSSQPSSGGGCHHSNEGTGN